MHGVALWGCSSVYGWDPSWTAWQRGTGEIKWLLWPYMLSAHQPNVCLSWGFSCGQTASSRAWLCWWKKSQPQLPIACCHWSGSYESPLMCFGPNKLLQPRPTSKSIHLNFRWNVPGNKYCSPPGTYKEECQAFGWQGLASTYLGLRPTLSLPFNSLLNGGGWLFSFYLLWNEVALHLGRKLTPERASPSFLISW